jgi:5'-AMP-activated protein kinase, regulatory beta subunit
VDGGGCGSSFSFGGCDSGMGNASAKEGDNGPMAMTSSPPLVAGGSGGSANAADAAAGARPAPLSPPDAVMLERPPHVPYLFAPQVMINYPKVK